jgi:hypothetical protein
MVHIKLSITDTKKYLKFKNTKLAPHPGAFLLDYVILYLIFGDPYEKTFYGLRSCSV